ncbi:MAG: UDP-glucose 4-epimerase GalE [Clostridia bacterium]|nr:UDP-glucose 4-epimerase GalE [Clostridia bacterium]
MNKTVLVTGGAGYIGSHTVVELLNADYDVLIADNLYNSKEAVLDRIETITGKRPAFCKVDVCDKEAMRKLFKENDFGAIIHFAGLKAVGESVAKPVEYYRNNLDANLTLLECMKEFDVRHIVFSSSATVYGIPKVPIKEDAPRWCTNPYGWTKFMGEQILSDFAAANPEMSVVLLRYFNPIGAHDSGLIGEDPQGIPNNLLPYINQVATGKLKKLRVFGNDYPTPDGTGVRDYIHVVDLAKGHLRALEYADAHTGSIAINLGTGTGYSVLDVIHAYENANGVKIPYEIVDRRPGDVAENYADPSLAKELLGWVAERDLVNMCKTGYHWQSMNPNGYDA